MGTKEYVLELLEKRRGESISGEELAQALHVSRTAVWKAVRDLRQEGYRIEAITNRGYSLSPDTDILSVQGILPYLPRKDWNIQVFPQLPSTNQLAKKLALEGEPNGAILIADGQDAGRGRMGRSFYSPSGSGIYMSFILRPQGRLSMAEGTLVTAAAAVAVSRAIAAYSGRQAGIKWVNDIYLDGKKVSGILAEASSDFETGSIDWIIIGVGLNFTTSSFPPELEDTAAAVCPQGGSRNEMIAQIIQQMEPFLQEQDFASCLEEYRKRSLVLNKEIVVHYGGNTYPAKAVAINDSGHLQIQLENGEKRTLSSGEVSVRL